MLNLNPQWSLIPLYTQALAHTGVLLAIGGTFVRVDTDFKYTFTEIQDRNAHRGILGDLRIYVNSPSYRKFELPVSHISSADKTQINSWWQTATTVRYYEEASLADDFYMVRVMGNEEPFPTFPKPYGFIEYTGELVLETV